MGLGTFLGGEALKELLRLSPQIITAAQQVYTTVTRNKRQGSDADAAMIGRIGKLEAADIAQAELLEQMARQLQAQAQALELLVTRIRFLTALAAGSLVLSTILIAAFLIWK
jgi:pantothenate kinase